MTALLKVILVAIAVVGPFCVQSRPMGGKFDTDSFNVTKVRTEVEVGGKVIHPLA